MNRTQLLLNYVPLADFIARMNGEHCEVLIHDVRDVEHSIIYVTEPSLTNRRPGNGMTDYAIELIRSKRYLQDPFVVNYVGGDSERVFRSSTFFIRDGEELAGLLCVNVEIDYLLAGIDALTKALLLDPDRLHAQERFSVGGTVDEQIEEVFTRRTAGRSPDCLRTSEKRDIVHELQGLGVFAVKGKVSEIAHRLDVSEKTVYRYLKGE